MGQWAGVFSCYQKAGKKNGCISIKSRFCNSGEKKVKMTIRKKNTLRGTTPCSECDRENSDL